MAKVYKNDIGVRFVVSVGTSITGGTNLFLKVLKPDSTSEVTWPATIYGSSYLVFTTTSTDDLNVAGKYKIQAYLTIGGWTGRGDTCEVIIYDNFK